MRRPKRVPSSWLTKHDCLKPRVDAYGGGTAIITVQEIKSIDSGQWLREHAG